MNKEELIINIEQFLILNQDDNRQLDSFKKQLNKLFEKYEIKVPLEDNSVAELQAKKSDRRYLFFYNKAAELDNKNESR